MTTPIPGLLRKGGTISDCHFPLTILQAQRFTHEKSSIDYCSLVRVERVCRCTVHVIPVCGRHDYSYQTGTRNPTDKPSDTHRRWHLSHQRISHYEQANERRCW